MKLRPASRPRALFRYLVAECWFGPAVSILQNALPPKVRGTGIAVLGRG